MKNSDARNYLVILLLLIFLAVFEILGVSRGFYRLLLPLATKLESVSSQILLLGLSPLQVIQKSYKSYRRIQDLELKYSMCQASLSGKEGVEAENNYLKELLGSTDLKAESTFIVSSISSLSQPAVRLPQQAHPSVGNPVLFSGVVLGRLSEINEGVAQIKLLNFENAQALLAKTSRGATGIIVGDGKRILFTEVDKEAAISVGDRVVTQGQLNVAPDLFVGTIRELISNPENPVQTAILQQPVDFYETSLLEIRQ